MDKRTFLKSLATLTVGGVYPASAMDSLLSSSLFMDPAKREMWEITLKDEAFWREVRKGYRLKPDYINLENGYYCMQPEYTLEKFIEQVRYVNFEASWYMRNYQWDKKDKIAGRLAEIGGCAPTIERQRFGTSSRRATFSFRRLMRQSCERTSL